MDYKDLQNMSEEQLRAALREAVQKNILLEQELSEKKALLKDATTNPISGLKNKNGYRQQLPKIRRYENIFSVFEIDTNFLKDMNDRFGHAQGDNFLRVQAQAMIEVVGKQMGLFNFDEKGNVTVPPNAQREMVEHDGISRPENDKEYLERVKDQVKEKDLYHIGGDEFRIIRPHKGKSPHQTEAEHLRQMSESDHAFMEQVLERFSVLWRIERQNIMDDSGLVCDLEASFGYGVANSSEPRLKGKTITDLQRVADNRAFYHKSWQKLSGRVSIPSGRLIEPLQSDRRLQGIAELDTLESLLAFVQNKEEHFSGLDKRVSRGSEGTLL